MKQLIPLSLIAVMIAGCTGNPTNEPTLNEIQKADDARAAAIDADPNMTPEDKAKIKEMLRLKNNGENR